MKLTRHGATIKVVAPRHSNYRVQNVSLRLTTLERQKWLEGLPSIWEGRFMAVSVKLIKAQDGRDQVDTFENIYLAAGAPDFKSEAAEEFAIGLAEKESEIYSTQTNYVRAVIQDITTNGKGIKGHTRSFPLELQGKFAIPVGDKLCGPHQVAKVERAAVFGKNGVGFYRNCITLDEYRAWKMDKEVPDRFRMPLDNPLAGGSTIWAWLMEEIGVGGLSLALPDSKGDIPVALRPVTRLIFGGFVENDPKRPKKSVYQQQLESLRAEVAETKRDVIDLIAGLANGLTLADVPAALDLIAGLYQSYRNYPLRVQLKVLWPVDVFGPVPQLPG